MVDSRLRELAQRSPNFGFLLEHEAVLVGYGAGAETLVFTDPNTSMIKARQFGEQLVAALVTTFGIRVPAGRDTQYKRLKVLLDQGVITRRVHSWFDTVRDTGTRRCTRATARSGMRCGWSGPATSWAPGSTAR